MILPIEKDWCKWLLTTAITRQQQYGFEQAPTVPKVDWFLDPAQYQRRDNQRADGVT